MVDGAGQAVRQRFGNRSADPGYVLLQVIIAKCSLHVALTLLAVRALGDNADGSGVSVLAVQGALWSIQYLDAFDVGKVGHAQPGAIQVDIVYEYAHRGFQGNVRLGSADAANPERCGVGLGIRGNGQGGSEDGQIVGICDIRFPDSLLIESVHRHGNILQALGTLGRRNDNLLQNGMLGNSMSRKNADSYSQNCAV